MIDTIITLTAVILGNFVFNAMLLIEYEEDFSVLQKRWARISFLFIGWVFLGAILITLLCGLMLFSLIEGFQKAFKKDEKGE